MFKTLVAIDGSEPSEAAVHELARQPFRANGEVKIISVIEPSYSLGMFPGENVSIDFYLEIKNTLRHRAHAAVAKAAANLRESDEIAQLTITTEVLSGSPKQVILEQAEAFCADLIVVGSHGQGMIERFLLGSVSQAIVLHAKCSVEVVRTKALLKQEHK